MDGDANINSSIAAYTSGRFSPKLIRPDSLELGTVIVDENEDQQRLAWARQRVVGAGQAVESVLTAEEKAMQREAQKAMSKYVLFRFILLVDISFKLLFF